MADETANTSMEQSVDEGDQEVVTLQEVIQSQQQMMDDANAVLGAIDDKKCTYSEGYMKRQALYSCLTCIPDAKNDPIKGGGVCLACSYYCHEGHELIELYTKRNFRCDCGNNKFSNQTCNLDSTKADINELNLYNQNFSGLYCTCKRPFPDPEDTFDDDMIQCIICEDWYHSRHLNTEIPSNSYSEMTCEACIKKHEFLLHYEELCANNTNTDEKCEVEVEAKASDEVAAVSSTTEDTGSAKPGDGDQMEVSEDISNVIDGQETDNSVINNGETSEPTMNSISSSETDATTSSTALQNGIVKTCIMFNKTKSEKVSTKFWADVDWRLQLCNCPKCLKMYEDEKVVYLLDPQDTVPVYEEKGKAKAREFEAKQNDDNMKYLNSLNRVPLIEAIAGFNDMKTNLIEYLKKFAENGKVVREEDIREFFSTFDAKKKQKCEVPHHCR